MLKTKLNLHMLVSKNATLTDMLFHHTSTNLTFLLPSLALNLKCLLFYPQISLIFL